MSLSKLREKVRHDYLIPCLVHDNYLAYLFGGQFFRGYPVYLRLTLKKILTSQYPKQISGYELDGLHSAPSSVRGIF